MLNLFWISAHLMPLLIIYPMPFLLINYKKTVNISTYLIRIGRIKKKRFPKLKKNSIKYKS